MRFLSILLLFVGIFAGFAFFVSRNPTSAVSPNHLLFCFAVSNERYFPDTPCLERTVTELLGAYSADELLRYITAPTAPTVVAVHGHAIAHFIGRQLFLKTKSIEASLDQCAPDSEYGCVHGVIGAAVVHELGEDPLDAEDLTHAGPGTVEKVGKKHCESSNLQFCHAAGHIIFQVFSDYLKALSMCSRVSRGDLDKREACARGAFMEGSAPVTSLYPDKKFPAWASSYRGICAETPSEFQHACFRYLPKIQMLLFEAEGITEATDRLSVSKSICAELVGAPRADCIEAIGFNAEGIFRDSENPDRQNFCDQFSDRDKQACVLGVVGGFIKTFDYRDGAEYCHDTKDSALQNFCFDALFQISEQVSMDPVMAAVCPSGLAYCRGSLEKYQATKSALPNYTLGLYGVTRE